MALIHSLSTWFLFIVSMSFSHADVVPIKFLVALTSLGILITITLNSISDKLLASISFSSFSGDSSFLFNWGLFLCLHIFSDSFCLFLHSKLTSFDTLSLWSGLL